MLIEIVFSTIIATAVTLVLEKSTPAMYAWLQKTAFVMDVWFRFRFLSQQSNNEWWFRNREKVIETMRIKVFSPQNATEKLWARKFRQSIS